MVRSTLGLMAARCLCFALVLSYVHSAHAQNEPRLFQAGVQFTSIASGEFDESDVGIAGRVSWYPTPLIGIEGELGLFPGDFAGKPAFSRSRVEGLFGATIGPRLGALRLFAKARPGFVRFGEAPGPLACIAIFPPPLPCVLAGGKTVPAMDLGGGLEWRVAGRTSLRLDVGDRVVRYPGPAFTSDRTAHQDPFTSHDLRLAVGAGIGF